MSDWDAGRRADGQFDTPRPSWPDGTTYSFPLPFPLPQAVDADDADWWPADVPGAPRDGERRPPGGGDGPAARLTRSARPRPAGPAAGLARLPVAARALPGRPRGRRREPGRLDSLAAAGPAAAAGCCQAGSRLAPPPWAPRPCC